MKPSPSTVRKRESIGDKYISGTGFEIGAGEAPSQYDGVEGVTYIDKRSEEWWEEMLGEPLPYHITTWGEALQGEKGDFFIAHHVIEHQIDPIGEFRKWLKLLNPRGRFFVSLPSPTNVCERSRLLTPIEHFIDDYVFERDFDDRQHIFSAKLQRFAVDPVRSRYFQYSAVGVARKLLEEMKAEDLDCHLHTFSLKVAKQVIEAACFFSGLGVNWLHTDDWGNSLYLTGEVCDRGAAVPEFILRYKKRLLKAQERIRI